MKKLISKIKKSWTMMSATFLAIGGVIETNFHLLKEFLGEQSWSVAYFTALIVLALARLRTLK